MTADHAQQLRALDVNPDVAAAKRGSRASAAASSSQFQQQKQAARPSSSSQQQQQEPSARRMSVKDAEAAERAAEDEDVAMEDAGQARLSDEAITVQQEMAAIAEGNVRLQHMNLALESFLGLVDVATEPDKLAAAIPNVPLPDLQRLSRDLVGKLKSFIIIQNAKLVQGFEIDVRLAELIDLLAEANQRIAKGLQPESDELKDAWRPHITDEHVVLARQIPEQEAEVQRLEAELQELEEDNARQEALLRDLKAQEEARVGKMFATLEVLGKTEQAIAPDEALKKRIHETTDSLLTEIGPRG